MGTNSRFFGLKQVAIFLVAFFLLLPYLSVVHLGKASAATQFTKSYVRLDSLKATDTLVTGRVCFQPTATTSVKSIQVTFPTTNGSTDYVLGAAANWTFNTSNLNTGTPLNETAIPGSLPATATTVSGHNLNFDITAGTGVLSTSTLYCFNWGGTTATLTLPATWTSETTPGQLTTYSSTGQSGVINQTQFSEPQVVSGTGDTVNVTATVPPSFNLALSAYADPFGNLSISSINSTGGISVTVNSNAPSGWILYIKDNANGTCAKGGLYSSSKNYCIKSSASIYTTDTAATNVEHYLTGITTASVGSAGTCSSITESGTGYPYDGATANNGGILDNVNYRPMATCNGTSTGSNVTFKEYADITGATPAATDYGDTIFVTGAGEF